MSFENDTPASLDDILGKAVQIFRESGLNGKVSVQKHPSIPNCGLVSLALLKDHVELVVEVASGCHRVHVSAIHEDSGRILREEVPCRQTQNDVQTRVENLIAWWKTRH